MFDLTREEVLKTLDNYEKIMDRVREVVGEIGFTNGEFDTFEANKTEFETELGTTNVCVTAYDSAYDLYDATSGSFPLDFLFEDESQHKDWYKKKREQARRDRILAEEQRKKEQELAELQRLKEKYE